MRTIHPTGNKTAASRRSAPRTRAFIPTLLVLYALSIVACSDPDGNAPHDAHADAIVDGAMDVRIDIALDGAMDTGDASRDAVTDTAPDRHIDVPGDMALDAGLESGADVPSDIALDAGSDAYDACANVLADGACSPCPTGYRSESGGCVDVDECSSGPNVCGTSPGRLCANTPGGFTCGCATGWTDSGTGTGACRWNDPSLLALVPSDDTLSPAFTGSTTMYTLAVDGTAVTLAATVAHPTRATIRVNGDLVASGASSQPIAVGWVPRPIEVTVVTEGGAMRTYTVVVSRRSTYVKASNTRGDALFGTSVAVSADGSTMAIGAPRENRAARGVNSDVPTGVASEAGAVYVFTRSGDRWVQQAYVKASNAEAFDQFGSSVALSNDGSTLAVGASDERSGATGVNGDQADNSAPYAGAAYVFSRTGSVWAQQAYLKASNAGAFDRFGVVVALSGDGATLAVGAGDESSNATGVNGDPSNDSAGSAGAVYVFARSGSSWSQQSYVKASNTGAGDRFGQTIALSYDGSTLAVGARYEDSSVVGVGGNQTDENARDAGAVYVYTRAGTTWSQQAYVKASNTGIGDEFGAAIALSDDGATLAVSAPREGSSATGVNGAQADNSATYAGATYVFTRTASGWTQQAYLKASNTDAFDAFGSAVALSGDGSVLVVSAALEDSSAINLYGDPSDDSAQGAGAVYRFERLGSVWSQGAYIKAANSGSGDQFGISVALSSDGSTLVAGANGEDSNATGVNGDRTNNAASAAGAVYVFR